jgi:peptide/nickel transport system substrate-binding protein
MKMRIFATFSIVVILLGLLGACAPAATPTPAPAAPAPATAAPAVVPPTQAPPTAVPPTEVPPTAAKPQGAASDPKTLYVLTPLDTQTLDPAVNYDFSGGFFLINCYEGLVKAVGSKDAKITPALAESWVVSPDGLTYTFKLRSGVKFHDGTPFNADAVKFTLDRVTDPATMAGQAHDQLGPYDHSEVVDDFTVKVIMRQGYAPLLTNFNGYLGIVSPTAVRKNPAGFARHPVGTGPFIFKEWMPKDHITLVRNPEYNWGSSFFKHTGAPYLDRLIFKMIPERSMRVGTLKTGETHYVEDIDPLAYEDLKSDPRFVVIEKGQPGSGYVLLLNTVSKGPVGEHQVRLAIEYAIDREGFNKSVFHGLHRVAASPLMKPTFGYDSSTEQIYPFDPERARQILDQAGWRAGTGGIREKGGRKLTIDFPVISRPNDKAMAESIQASLRDVGIDVRVNPLERAAYNEERVQNRYDANFVWFPYGDPDVLRTIFHSANINAFNRAKYQVPEVDRMLEEAAATIDAARRADLYARIQQRVLKDAVVVPLVDTITHNAKRAEVQGEYMDALGSYVYLNDVQVRR